MERDSLINFIPTYKFEQINVFPAQEKNISSTDKIRLALKQENNKGFYIYLSEKKIGFILLNQFTSDSYFLWDFIIDKDFQNMGFGKHSLAKLCDYLKKEVNAKLLTTTYINGNQQAKKLYETIGFQEIEKVNVNGITVINLRYFL